MTIEAHRLCDPKRLKHPFRGTDLSLFGIYLGYGETTTQTMRSCVISIEIPYHERARRNRSPRVTRQIRSLGQEASNPFIFSGFHEKLESRASVMGMFETAIRADSSLGSVMGHLNGTKKSSQIHRI